MAKVGYLGLLYGDYVPNGHHGVPRLWVPMNGNPWPDLVAVLEPRGDGLAKIELVGDPSFTMIFVTVKRSGSTTQTYIGFNVPLCINCSGNRTSVRADMATGTFVCPRCGPTNAVSSIGFERRTHKAAHLPYEEVERYLKALEEGYRAQGAELAV